MGVRKPEDTRSLALCAHGGAGKTSLAEAMLFDNGNITRMGNVQNGNTVSDFQSEEQKRNISISTSLLTLERKGKTFYVLDAPGYADFTGEMSAAIRVADTAVILVSSVGGIEVQTSKAWEYAEHHNAPVSFVISKMDRENADFQKVLDDIKSQFSQNALPVFLPIGAGEKFTGIVDVLRGKAYTYKPDGSGKFTEGDVPSDMAGDTESAKEALIEAAIEMDDELMEKYLEGETVSDADIERTLKKAIAAKRIMPVFALSATANIGVPSSWTSSLTTSLHLSTSGQLRQATALRLSPRLMHRSRHCASRSWLMLSSASSRSSAYIPAPSHPKAAASTTLTREKTSVYPPSRP